MAPNCALGNSSVFLGFLGRKEPYRLLRCLILWLYCSYSSFRHFYP